MADTKTTADIGQARRYINKKIYNVFLFDEVISTTVTKSESAIGEWISRVYTVRDAISADFMIIGLDAIGPNSDRYFTLQLCANCSCLVIQIRASKSIPESLGNFLADENIVFVGVDVKSKLETLSIDYGIGSEAFYVDVGHLASVRYEEPVLKNCEIEELIKYVLAKEVRMPMGTGAITDFNWDAGDLVHMQVLYATVSAFFNLEIGSAAHIDRFISYFRGRNADEFFSL